jgi:hypothetical protein
MFLIFWSYYDKYTTLLLGQEVGFCVYFEGR